VTTPGTTVTDAEGTTAGSALADALEVIARLHDEAMATIAALAETGDATERVVRLVELPSVGLRAEAAAA
jgi:hypothetical protein